jgi:SAM-dependent methyltransferase
MNHQHTAHPQAPDTDDPIEFWENRYGEKHAIWSGRANRMLVDTVADLPPGRALDLGCGEGGDAIWLAERGWAVTGVDISPTAVARATRAATDRGLSADFRTVDLETWRTEETFDLVTACFLQSPLTFGRAEVLRRAAGLVAPGGHLLSVAHAAAPPWSGMAADPTMVFPTPAGDLAALAVGADWDVVIAEVRARPATGPDGQQATLDDSVVLVRRRALIPVDHGLGAVLTESERPPAHDQQRERRGPARAGQAGPRPDQVQA